MTEPQDIQISAEVTPNPNTLKFNVNRLIMASGSVNYPDREKAKGSKLERLFDVKDVLGVMVGRDFITVTKNPAADWQPIVEPVTRTIKDIFAEGPILFAPAGATAGVEAPAGANADIEQRIKDILDAEIRPAVNMDGGDITFHGYYDGVVTLHLQGSCSSCPSAIMTLKMGVENRLKALIPEIREVVQV